MPGFDAAARHRLADALKAEARRLGFDAVGVATAGPLDDEARRLEAWLARGFHAGMGWMANHFDKRVDPRLLVEGARSVVSVLHSYHRPERPADGPGVGRVARYAWGDDYHDVLKAKLAALFDWLDREVGGAGGRAFADSAPVMDKVWAQRAGLGWIGKNGNLLSRRLGSYVFVGELIVDVPLEPDGPETDHCGTCTRCLDACPTGAITEPRVVDANRCIAYLTIEHRGDLPEGAPVEGVGNWVFGCDVCQEVCPWTKFSRDTDEPRFAPRANVVEGDLAAWEELDLEAWRVRFRGSAVKRTKYEGFRRNLALVRANAPRGGERP